MNGSVIQRDDEAEFRNSSVLANPYMDLTINNSGIACVMLIFSEVIRFFTVIRR